MKTPTLLVIAALALGAAQSHAQDILKALNDEQRAELDKGQLVVTQNNREGPWPELTVYTKVNAPVSAVRDVFMDYDNAHNYIPNLVSAKVIAEPSANVKDVEYTSRMPILGNSTYSVRNFYETSGDAVTVRWELLQSGMADISEGSLKVEPMGDGSVLRYINFVKPKSSVAIVARGAALNEVKRTVTAIKTQAESRAGR